MNFTYYENTIYMIMLIKNHMRKSMNSLERLIKNIRTLYSNIKESFKKEKNVTI